MKRNGELRADLTFVFAERSQLEVILAPPLKSLYIGDISENEAFKISSIAENLSIDNIKKNGFYSF